MTPAEVLAGIPAHLIRRWPSPDRQLAVSRDLAGWLLERGHRPSLFELEEERARRATPKETT